MKLTKDVNLRGISSIEGQEVVQFSASVNQEGGNNFFSMNITNIDLYDKNITECREDMDEFITALRSVEDEMKQNRSNVNNPNTEEKE